MEKRIYQIQTCLTHLSLGLSPTTNSVLQDDTKCNCTCKECIDADCVCEMCCEKGHTSIHPALRACDLCLMRGEKCIKVAILGVSIDSESKQQAAAASFEDHKRKGNVTPHLELVSFFPDPVHVAKRMARSASNWFLFVENQHINRIFLRTLRCDPALKAMLAPHLTVAATRNRDRMDVHDTMQICSSEVCAVLESNVKYVMDTLVPEKYRVCDVNKRGVLSNPVDVCKGPKGQLLLTDITKEKLFMVRLHYPADVTVVHDKIKAPMGVAYYKGVALVACESNICWINLTNDMILEPKSMTVQQLTTALKAYNCFRVEDSKLKKAELQNKLSKVLASLSGLS